MNTEELRSEIFELEFTLQKPVNRQSSAKLEELLADQFVEFAADGKRYDKKEIISSLAEEEGQTNFEMTDFRVMELSDSVVLATYNATKITSGKEEGESLRSSIWEKKESGWRMIFHQGTTILL